MVEILDGSLVARITKSKIKEQVDGFVKKTNTQPCLATVLVGSDPASHIYVKNKLKTTVACGMKSIHHELPEAATQEQVVELIDQLNNDKSVHGILVQLPLPAHLNSWPIIEMIDPLKDVDCFHPFNEGLVLLDKNKLLPCTPAGVMVLLKHYNIPIQGKHAVILGKSNIVGKPMMHMLLKEYATVTVCHKHTQDSAYHAKQADILVSAVGKAGLVTADWVKEGAVVVDVGINRNQDGKLCGDVDFETVSKKASYITPVPGGVGPMTIAMLMNNTLRAAKLQHFGDING